MGRKLIRVAIVGICLVVGVGIVRSIYTLSQKKGIIAERQQVLRELMEKNKQLQEDLKQATGSSFIEQAARDKLGLVREGETVVIMDQTRVENFSNKENLQELPSWKQWWRLFF
jgi:cell division protein FtsB